MEDRINAVTADNPRDNSEPAAVPRLGQSVVESSTHRRWWAFTALLLLTLVAGWSLRQAVQRAARRAEQRLFNEQIAPHGATARIWQGRVVQVAFSDVPVSSDTLQKLRHLPEMKRLVLIGVSPDEDALSSLPDMAALRELVVLNTPITDEHLEPLARCRQLRTLRLSGTRVTAEGLGHIRNLALERVDLQESPINDEGLEHLAQLSQLQQLTISGTDVTQEAMLVLQSKLPLAHLRWRR